MASNNIAIPKKTDKNIAIQEKLDKKAQQKELISAILPFTGLVFITVALIILTDGILIRGSNMINLLNQSFTVMVVAVGAAFVFSHGGIDFSIGAASGLSQYVMIMILTVFGLPVWVAIMASIALCVTSCTLVGASASVLRVPVFVTSLCIRAVCAGLLATGANAAGGQMRTNYSDYIVFNNPLLKGAVLVAIVALGYFLFEKGIAGRNLKAIGGNPLTAAQAGMKVEKNKILAFTFLGLCLGIAAFFQLTRMGTVTANSGMGLEFDVMLAIILGGFPMAGGSTSKMRAVIVGAVTSVVLSNGLIIWGLDVNIVNGAKGLLFIVIVAISFDRSNLKQIKLMS